MKRIIFTLNLILLAIIITAQVPVGFSYQAVVRNTSGDIVAGKAVKFRFSILINTETGTYLFRHCLVSSDGCRRNQPVAASGIRHLF